MKVVFLSNFYPRCRRNFYLSRSKSGLAAAADAHQYALALGLQELCSDLCIVNSPSIFPYPTHYKDTSIPSEILNENGMTIHNIGFSTVMEYQFISRYKKIYKELKGIVENTNEIVYIIVYATNISLLKAATKIKSSYKNVRLNMIVPDLPQDMENHKLLARFIKALRNLYFKSPERYYKYFDSFVLLTDYMKEKIECNNDQYIVSEGIYEETVTKRISHKENSNRFVIFYGGMLHKKFGIMNLVEAIRSIDSPNVQLQLCGYGDCVDSIKKLSQIDNRIQYLGVVDRDDVLNYQSKASLLVNPRIPDENPFTRYSFPSKTMEYFASGTPTLLYQLEGIPQEYYQYCYSLDSHHTSKADLAHEIQKIMKIPVVERLKMAADARNFILKEKNQTKAANHILSLLIRTI